MIVVKGKLTQLIFYMTKLNKVRTKKFLFYSFQICMNMLGGLLNILLEFCIES